MGSALEPQVDGDLSRWCIGDQHRHGQRVDPLRAPAGELRVLLVHGGESTDAGSQHHGDALRGDALHPRGGHPPGLAGCDQGQLGATVGAAPQQWRKGVEGIVGNSACNLHR